MVEEDEDEEEVVRVGPEAGAETSQQGGKMLTHTTDCPQEVGNAVCTRYVMLCSISPVVLGR